MNILVIADTYPMADRNSGDLRFFTLMKMMSERHAVHFAALGERRQAEAIGATLTMAYRQRLADMGIAVVDKGVFEALRSGNFGCVFFEWYFTAPRLIDEARERQPDARIVIDAVDVVFNRMESKANLTGTPADQTRAAEIRRKELSVYEKSDVVITVTDADAEILHHVAPGVRTWTVPNIHPMHEPAAKCNKAIRDLIFVGSFTHEPNNDAVHYFCNEVLPLILAAEPDVRLRIVGSSPPPAVRDLASANVEILGYVPETRPYLEASSISIAPLRFGGGMKGKIGEAMSVGLPVVTTSVGVEGFGLSPGKHVIVADDAQSFADAVLGLLRDHAHRERLGMAGYRFIREHYSEEAARKRVHGLFDRIETFPVHQMSALKIGLRTSWTLWQRHVAWRLK